MNDKAEARFEKIMEEMDITEEVAKAVCPHLQYCGNELLANGEVDAFICRKNLLEYNRRDKMLIIIPYTNVELQDCLRRFCTGHFGETCEIAESFVEVTP